MTLATRLIATTRARLRAIASRRDGPAKPGRLVPSRLVQGGLAAQGHRDLLDSHDTGWPGTRTVSVGWFAAGLVSAAAVFLGYELVAAPALAAQSAPLPPRAMPPPLQVQVVGEVAQPGGGPTPARRGSRPPARHTRLTRFVKRASASKRTRGIERLAHPYTLADPYPLADAHAVAHPHPTANTHPAAYQHSATDGHTVAHQHAAAHQHTLADKNAPGGRAISRLDRSGGQP
jgi:hypothetical protein